MFVVVAGLAGGCATAQPPKQAHIEASSAIRAAEELVRTEKPMPDAELYLARARDQIRAGERLLEKRSYQTARHHFERAEAEAETAISLARAQIAENDAREAEARLGAASASAEDVDVKVNVDEDDDEKPEVEINVD
jgi:hypothetical protein